jgi:hypothetical protein
MVLLVLGITGLDRLAEEQGDPAALAALRGRSDALTGEIDLAGGAVLQETSGLLLASFPAASGARDAFLRAQARSLGDCSLHGAKLGCCGAIAEGSAMVLTRAGGIELFGRTVLQAIRSIEGRSEGLVELRPASGISLRGAPGAAA